jgi:MFS family permease
VDGLARTRLASPAALAGEAIGFASLYLSAGALMPLLVVYQGQWHFPSALLTLAFAVFAVGFLAAVLTVGSLSDQVGRRPVLLAALAIQLSSNVVFLTAPNVGWVIAGRIAGGLATGAATPAFTAALVELAPPSRKGLGTVLGSVGLTGGLAVGSLLAGLAIQFTTDSNAIVFTALTIITVCAIGVVALAPETVTPTPATLRALIPRVSVPCTARAEFAAAAPVIAAVWMCSGLSGGLAPSMVKSVFGVDSGLLSGLSGFVSPAMSAVVGLAVARMDPRRAMTIGILATILGGIGIASGPLCGSLTVMIIGQTIAGAGFGASFAASLRLILPLAAAHQRATVVASVYLVSYLAFGAPIVIAGQLVEPVGLVPTVFWYTVTTVLLALIGLRAQRSRSPRIAERTEYEHID